MSSRTRIPFPWEAGAEYELPSGSPLRDGAALMLAREFPDSLVRGSAGGCGELRSEVDPRDTRQRLYREALDLTDGSPAAQSWAADKSTKAIRSWDRSKRSNL